MRRLIPVLAFVLALGETTLRIVYSVRLFGSASTAVTPQ